MNNQAASSTDAYAVAGVLVHVKKTNAQVISQQLAELSGVEVHSIVEDSKLVVTIEEYDNEKIMLQRFSEIGSLKGVLNVSLIYSENALTDDTGKNLEEIS